MSLLALWFSTIVLSTLLVYQHHFIDLPTGALVGFLAVYFISKKRDNSVLKAFMTPRHYAGHSRDKVDVIMEEIRPNYVKSAYMGISLDVYEEYLEYNSKK